MVIRKYQEKDYDRVVEICLDTADPAKQAKPVNIWVKEMFCRYYIEKEPESCFVAVDGNDVPMGYCYGAVDYDKYASQMDEFLKAISELDSENYLSYSLVEMYNHYIYKDKYPAHLHIDFLAPYRGKGYGTALINALCDDFKARGVKGVMLIVGSDNPRAQNFYEKIGFELLNKKKSGYAYGKALSEG